MGTRAFSYSLPPSRRADILGVDQARNFAPATKLAEHALIDHARQRSLGFLESDGEQWACFLVTFRGRDDQWHGHLSFRPRDSEGEIDEVRTADIFIEASEEAIDQKARGLGRPLLRALFSSVLHVQQRDETPPPKLRKWFRTLLSENSQEMAAAAGDCLEDPSSRAEVAELRSLYASYRLDQVCHFIALLRPDDFESAVDLILEGQQVDFGARDRLQLAMMVVEYIESRIPMPPFEAWTVDFLASRQEYLLYAHTLHREGRLP